MLIKLKRIVYTYFIYIYISVKDKILSDDISVSYKHISEYFVKNWHAMIKLWNISFSKQ